MSFFAEDCTFLMARGPEPEGRRVHGKAAVRKVLGDRFRVITDMRWDHVDSFITGNRAVTVWMVTGTGVDGEKLNYRGCDLYEFRGDKVLNKDTYWKTGGAPRPPLSTGCTQIESAGPGNTRAPWSRPFADLPRVRDVPATSRGRRLSLQAWTQCVHWFRHSSRHQR